MFTKKILSGARDKLDDWKGYGKGFELWNDSELFDALVSAINDWVRETRCFRDSSTEAICKVPLLANQHTFPMDSRIIAVHEGRLLSGWPYIQVKDELWLSDHLYSWQTRTGYPRYVVPDYEVGKLRAVPYFNAEGYFSGTMTFTAGDNKITMAGAKFSDFLSAGTQVVISTTVSNNGTKTVVTASADDFTVSETVTDETVSTVVQKIMDTLWLSTDRLPLIQVSLANWESESPEINFDYHAKLVYGILREAYEKDDAETYDPELAAKYRGIFQGHINKAKKEKLRLRHSTRVLRPNPGLI